MKKKLTLLLLLLPFIACKKNLDKPEDIEPQIDPKKSYSISIKCSDCTVTYEDTKLGIVSRPVKNDLPFEFKGNTVNTTKNKIIKKFTVENHKFDDMSYLIQDNEGTLIYSFYMLTELISVIEIHY